MIDFSLNRIVIMLYKINVLIVREKMWFNLIKKRERCVIIGDIENIKL